MRSKVVLAQRSNGFSDYLIAQLLYETEGLVRRFILRTERIRDKDISVMDIMDNWPETLSVFMKYRMLCIGCSIAPFHTIKEACDEHQLEESVIRAELDKAVANCSALNTAE
jgi:hybrid cluster-associated redox disulfide protein